MRYRPLLPRSSNARMIYGRLRLQSSAALQASQTSKITGYAVPSYLLEGLRQDAPAATEPKFIISLGNVPSRPKTLELQWSEVIQLFQNLESVLLMSLKECSGPH
jgi:hypothetical protein